MKRAIKKVIQKAMKRAMKIEKEDQMAFALVDDLEMTKEIETREIETREIETHEKMERRENHVIYILFVWNVFGIR